jgi:Iap family predicted aminopeptidase
MVKGTVFSMILALCSLGITPTSLVSPAEALAYPDQGANIATADEFTDLFRAVPCKDRDRLQAAQDLLQKMGAPADAIRIQHYKSYGGVDDIVVVKPGETEEKIVVGAHYDKVVWGCGAVDNWTGVATVAFLYRTLKDKSFKKTLEFVLFGKEESGLLGSMAMLGNLDKSELNKYCAMVNIDSTGMATPQTPENMSSKKLIELADAIAANLKMRLSHPTIPGAGADSMSFNARKIPAITICGLNSDWQMILHHDADRASKIDPKLVWAGYILALNMVVNIDKRSCESLRN